MTREEIIKGLLGIHAVTANYKGDQVILHNMPMKKLTGILYGAAELLKAQEPTSTPEAEWLLYKGRHGATCSFCKHTYNDVYDAENYDYYCRHCGAKIVRIRTVKWDG